VHIRSARPEDAEALVSVHEQASADLFLDVVGKALDELLPFEARLEQARASLAHTGEDGRILVADDDGGIVGFAVLRKVGDEGEVKDLHVIPSAWGTGVATALMEAAVDAMAAMGISHTFLWVGTDNPRARRFYEREGWGPDGRSQPSPLGPLELRYVRSVSALPPE
jgi:GNAT superfamily N-acetyltransferase